MAPSARFQSLLDKLALEHELLRCEVKGEMRSQHERELEALREQVSRLQAKLLVATGQIKASSSPPCLHEIDVTANDEPHAEDTVADSLWKKQMLDELDLFDGDYSPLPDSGAVEDVRGAHCPRDPNRVVEVVSGETGVVTSASGPLSVDERDFGRSPRDLACVEATKEEDATGDPDFVQTAKRLSTQDLTTYVATQNSVSRNITRDSLSRIIMRPGSRTRLTWDVLSTLMVTYDLFTIPLLAFGYDDMEAIATIDLIITIFWTMDLVAAFLTGYHSGSGIEMRIHMTARKYLSHSSNHTAAAFLKVQRLLAQAHELLKSETSRALVNVALAVIIIVTLNHYIGCGFFLIGTEGERQGRDNWIDTHRMKGEPVIYQYMTSLHWSLTQFTPAAMEVTPENLWERMYSIVALLFAMLTFSSFLGTITTTLTSLRKRSTEAAMQKHQLRKFFLDNAVSNDLAGRIMSYLKKNHFTQKKRMHMSDLEVLKLLPASLKKGLNMELYLPYLTKVPILHHLSTLNEPAMSDITNSCTKDVSYLTGEHMFLEGKEAKCMYFLVSGCAWYDHEDRERQTLLRGGSWACEPILWMPWVHCASLKATFSSEAIELDGQAFVRIVSSHSDTLPFVSAYATGFVAYINELNQDSSMLWRTDLWNDVEALDDITITAWTEKTWDMSLASKLHRPTRKKWIKKMGGTMSYNRTASLRTSSDNLGSQNDSNGTPTEAKV
eukprot:CAMPEP_0170653284 /NCGR_PEP_ID=MMETSP0224-20130122/47328_1 /TAXON_ID=285029 /ORGANISM="Togula jolla, Strain CCCM 725" /LENGTH=722 /DNA_ID=CAMNT_0010985151 /DNA_START=12 /DNA_END=2183 /DNA_ORIENTATION=-